MKLFKDRRGLIFPGAFPECNPPVRCYMGTALSLHPAWRRSRGSPVTPPPHPVRPTSNESPATKGVAAHPSASGSEGGHGPIQAVSGA
jgi:hypothetical protein